MQKREFPCDVWFVRHSAHFLTKFYPDQSPIRKETAIKETDKSVTTAERRYGKEYTQCHHKVVMRQNHEAFFYSEQEAKDFYLTKLNEKQNELFNLMDGIDQNRATWATTLPVQAKELQ